MPICPVCERENAGDARFCSACGAALSSDPPREERKVVTVLFADLVGFTARAEQLDPEDVRAVLAPYWERLRAELEQRGGTVEKFIGDAVMALFGAPAAHDDDPLRAVGAALAIRDWAREEADVQVRIAVNTGEALVVLGAREGEGMAAGDVVNTAARLQSAAPVNGVLVGESTYRATRDVIEYAGREPVVAKGKVEPVPVWEAVQVRSRLGMDVERATLPLVGRTRELGVIRDAFERAKAEREPQLVTLVGVPGIGKSRLVGEFFAQLESQPDLVWWRQGRALPYGDGVSFWAVAEMVKAQAGIEENDTREVAAEKLHASVEHVVDDAEREWVGEHLRPLVGAGQRTGGDESAPAWRRYFEGLAEQRPLVLVFEDMHWADDGLLDFIDHLVDWATGVPLLVIATARPELLDRRRAWGGGKLNVSTIALTPLTDEEAAEIIRNVLEQGALPLDTQHALLERAGGNPLYAEQFARLYLERGSADDLPLPETVQGLIAARVDGLPPDEKRLLQDASVYGKVFWAGALGDGDVATALHALERKGLLRRERRSAVGGETQYAFRHVLVRDVAYGQIPRAARVEKHLEAAAWIERLGRGDDHAELVAHHWKSVLELRRPETADGGSVATAARAAFGRAGSHAFRLGRYDAAARFLEDALALRPDDATRLDLLFELARARHIADGSVDVLDEAIELLVRAGDVERAAELSVLRAVSDWHAGRHDVAAASLEQARRLLEGRPPSGAQAAALAESARVEALAGEREAALGHGRAALELAERLGLDDLRWDVLSTLGIVHMADVDVATAVALYRDVLGEAPSTSHVFNRAATNLSVAYEREGAMEESYRLQDLVLENARRSGDRLRLRWMESFSIRGRLYVEGRWNEALEAIEAFLRAVADEGGHEREPAVRATRACILAARGEVAAAEAEIAAVEGLLGDRDAQQRSAQTSLELAYASSILGDRDAARDRVDRARPLVTLGEVPVLTGDYLATVLRVGRETEWLELVRERFGAAGRGRIAGLAWSGRPADAADLLDGMGVPGEAAAVRVAAAERLLAGGRAAEARTQLERGLAFFRAVGARRVVEQAEALLAASS